MVDDPELRKLVEKGKELAVAAEDQAEAREREERDEAARERLMKRLASVSSYVRFGWVFVSLALALAWGLLLRWALPESWFHSEGESDPGSGIIALSTLLMFAPTWRLRRRVGERAWLAEKAWVAALPFQLEGYPELLDRSPGDCVAETRVSFSGSEPSPGVLEAVLRNLGTVDEGGRVAKRTFDWSGVDSSTPMTNAFLRSHVRETVKTLLVLHASYPLAAVTVRVSGS